MVELVFILMVLFPAFLYFINGPTHTTGQFLLRAIVFAVGLVGIIVLEIRKRKRFKKSEQDSSSKKNVLAGYNFTRILIRSFVKTPMILITWLIKRVYENAYVSLLMTPLVSSFLRFILILYSAIISFPLYLPWSFYRPGLDTSWIFSINYQFVNKLGEYVAWTGGPFEFLMFPLNIGANFDKAVLFQISLWFIFFSLLIYVIVKNDLPLFQVFLFTILFANATFLRYCYQGFVDFLILFLLSLSFFMKRWYIPYIGVLLLSALSWFMKFNTALLSTLSVIFFVFLMFFQEKRTALKSGLLAITLLPLFFIVPYLIYNPSLSNMISYVRGLFEISNGYSVMLGLPGHDVPKLISALLITIVYCVTIIFLYKYKKKSFIPSLLFIPSLFIAFKSGFVRQDIGHELQFFYFASAIFSFIFLHTKIIDRKKEYIAYLIITISIISICANIRFPGYKNAVINYAGIGNFLSNANALIHYSDTKKYLDSTKKSLDPLKLSEDWGNTIGQSKMSIFPWELNYAAANKMNYEPFPVFQSYSAYSSYLDLLNSRYIEDQQKAPEFILMEWASIDGRHPVADVPAMWVSIYKWYGVTKTDANKLLLQRRSLPRFSNLQFIKKQIYKKGNRIEIPKSDHPVIAKISIDFNFIGKMLKIIYKIPQVKMKLISESGLTSTFRIVPDNLRNGLLINYFPQNLHDVNSLLSSSESNQRTQSFQIYGEGLKLLKDEIKVEFFDVPDLRIKYTSASQ